MAAQTATKEIWVTCVGELDVKVARSFSQLLVNAASDQVTKIHVLIQSPGGTINEGIFLHEFFKSFPVEVVAYNGGHIGSASLSAYLGARKRYVCANGTFLVHRAKPAPVNTWSLPHIQSIVDGLQIEDARTEAVLRSSANLTQTQWSVFSSGCDLTLDAKTAIEVGIAHCLGSFTPAGPMYSL
jgi:ATP-dependent Clp protease, protease subunit